MKDRQSHWENAWQSGAPGTKSWHQENPAWSLQLIDHCALEKSAAIIDVGAGASLLTDCLLDLGYSDLTVLDISAAALRLSRQRLGPRAEEVCWIAADITEFRPQRAWDLWHDRAVFHFLTRQADRNAYKEVLLKALQPGGFLVLSGFAEDGPLKCSGLEVTRYGPESISEQFAPEFELLEDHSESHKTPMGTIQHFGYYRFARIH